MDVKVITRHAPSNYGSLLQSIATISVIKGMGHDCNIIDYERNDERGLQAILTPLKRKADYNGSFVKKLAYICLRYPEEKWAEMKFDRMRHYYLDMTERISTKDGLKTLKADVFMTGSDQVWGPTLNGEYDDAYFLSFVSKGKKLAYAASFGRTDFTEKILKEYSVLLSKYDNIAVREDSAVDLLKQMNVPCAGQVLDPTLLLTGDEWSKYIKRDIQGKYVLVYQLHKNPDLDEYAMKLANYVGLPLYRISPTFHQVKRGGKFVYLPDMDEFLSYIKNCTYFVTDSFHGTAFAINFNKQFVEILPNNKTGSRNQSILRLLGLEDRIVKDLNNYSITERLIDYDIVNNILSNEREKSLKILDSIICD
ncbi:MAG: polysaccharide pyruvyl transferase family protein [Prevotellaceae bacterium]|nr:polysaccharide pyruvyl transferase family protein [Prevotellaceae bacterium]